MIFDWNRTHLLEHFRTAATEEDQILIGPSASFSLHDIIHYMIRWISSATKSQLNGFNTCTDRLNIETGQKWASGAAYFALNNRFNCCWIDAKMPPIIFTANNRNRSSCVSYCISVRKLLLLLLLYERENVEKTFNSPWNAHVWLRLHIERLSKHIRQMHR